MSVNVTPEQSAAISSRGKVIVSASAGSGKTFVMIERLVSLIINGTDVRNVLCVTFTNKAADEMRTRLRNALLGTINENGCVDRARFKAQLSALPLADISTIHAFCAKLVRTHFFLAGADPAFRIISPEDAEGKTLSARALDEAFEDAYEYGGEDFAKLLAVYFRKKKDARLRGIVLSLYGAVRGSADYRAILEDAGKEDKFPAACLYLAENYCERVLVIKARLEGLTAFFENNFPRALTVCTDVKKACDDLLSAGELFPMVQTAKNPPVIAKMPPMTKAVGETLTNLKFLSCASKAVKDIYGELREYAEIDVERARYEDARVRARALADLALKYDEIYSRLKREANVLDYEDLEHFALKILSDETARQEISAQYEYVFVDEYQDVNPVQEKILSLVSGKETFLVGDAKQAIYGFRGSRSEYFLNKEKEFENSLHLTSNFRSASGVLEAVNRVFAPLYPDYAPMRGGNRYGDYAGEVRIHRIPEEKKTQEARGVYSVLSGGREEKTDPMSEQVADLVESECGKVWLDAKSGKSKTVTFGDIAILMRTNLGDTERIVRALTRRGIPVTTSSRVNICECFEAQLVIDWLSFLDNAEQDVPYAAALLSAIGGFTDGELAEVRLRCPAPYTFRAACSEYCEKFKDDALAVKLVSFENKAKKLRTLSRVRTAAEMINTLLSEGLEAQIAAKQGGRERLARIRRLVAEAENCGNIHAFLTRLKAADYNVDFSESGGDGAVKVLTMHASKGLEYPVVILAGLDALLRNKDSDDVMYTELFGVAPRCFSAEEKTVYDTVLRRAAALLQEKRGVDDECNLLYVAMTRACCRLHLTLREKDRALSPKYAKRFSDFIDLAACADYFEEEEQVPPPPLERKMLGYKAEKALAEKIRAVYAREYGYQSSTAIPVKSSATALMRTERSEELLHDESVRSEKHSAGYSAETGTAYHAFLQHVAFGKDAGEELSRMRKEGILTDERIALLDESKLNAIMNIPCLKSLAGKRVFREQTFLVKLQADEILSTDAADEIVFQGAIDLLCEDGNGYTIIDYKFSSHDDDRIRKDYLLQIRLYKKAVARIMRVDERNVKACIVNIAQCREIPM